MDGVDLDDHVDLLGLLDGSLPAREAVDAAGHLRDCAVCDERFIDLAMALGRVHDARRYPPADPSEVPPLRLELGGSGAAASDVVAPRRARPRLGGLPAAAAACALVLALAGGVAVDRWRGSAPPGPATVALAAVGQLPTVAQGRAQMVGSGDEQRMRVVVSGLPRIAAVDHYEVWLLDTTTGRSSMVGALDGGTTTFALAAARTSGFNVVDITLQTRADGGRHSGRSLLRGALA